MKRKLATVWQWAGLFSGITGLIVLLKLVDGNAVFAAMSGANILFLLPAALLVLFTTAVRSVRWIFLFRQHGVKIPFRRIMGTNLIGAFYGQFLPLSSAVGATLLLGENAKSGGRAVDFVATVVVERVLNLVSLFVTASVVLLLAQPAGVPAGVRLTIHVTSASLLMSLLLLRRASGPGRIQPLLARLRSERMSQYLGTLRRALGSDLGQRQVLTHGIALSVLVNASVMGTSYLVTLAVAGPLPILSFLALATLIVALQGIPITPGSLGVRESLYLFFLSSLGVSEPTALTVGLLVMALGWFQGIVGGLVLLQRSLPQLNLRRALGRASVPLLPQRERVSEGIQ